ARRPAHFHFRIDATREFGVRMEFFPTTSQLKEIQRIVEISFSRRTRLEWSIGCRKSSLRDPIRDVHAWIAVFPRQSQQRWRTQVQVLANPLAAISPHRSQH